MALSRKDVAAAVLTSLVVLVFAATYQGWSVPLVGDSHRWAAGVILLLGMITCSLGAPTSSNVSKALGVLGVLAAVLGIWALITGSLVALSLLVIDVVVLFATATALHAWHPPRKPIAAA
jgi:hypothetical protein